VLAPPNDVLALVTKVAAAPATPTARPGGLLPAGNTFYQMKSRETFAPMGPYLVTADEVPNPHSLKIRLWVNAVLKQNFNTSNMAHKIPRCIEWVSSIHPIEPGDVLATGTNHRGLSAFQDGDQIELEADGLGRQEKKLEGTTPQLTGKYAPGH